jgi:hypothetical protein
VELKRIWKECITVAYEMGKYKILNFEKIAIFSGERWNVERRDVVPGVLAAAIPS